MSLPQTRGKKDRAGKKQKNISNLRISLSQVQLNNIQHLAQLLSSELLQPSQLGSSHLKVYKAL
jgi:hypothetical protein